MSINPFESMSAPDYPATCTECGFEGTNDSMYSHTCVHPESITLTFHVTVTAKRSALERHLGEEQSRELRQGGAIYLEELVPEFEFGSSEIIEFRQSKKDGN